MPENPDVNDLVAHTAKIRAAQSKLRDAMTAVAKEIAATPPPPAPAGKPA